jgi:hypothetical protein
MKALGKKQERREGWVGPRAIGHPCLPVVFWVVAQKVHISENLAVSGALIPAGNSWHTQTERFEKRWIQGPVTVWSGQEEGTRI